MGYGRGMGYGINFPANKVGGSKNLWSMGMYGLQGIWVMREATVARAQALPFNGIDTAMARFSNSYDLLSI